MATIKSALSEIPSLIQESLIGRGALIVIAIALLPWNAPHIDLSAYFSQPSQVTGQGYTSPPQTPVNQQSSPSQTALPFCRTNQLPPGCRPVSQSIISSPSQVIQPNNTAIFVKNKPQPTAPPVPQPQKATRAFSEQDAGEIGKSHLTEDEVGLISSEEFHPDTR